jgi:hypothetical protein
MNPGKQQNDIAELAERVQTCGLSSSGGITLLHVPLDEVGLS